MATELGSLVYTLRLDDAGFSGQLSEDKEKVAGASQGMTSSMNETEKAAGGLKGAFSSMAGQFVVGQAVFTAGQKVLGGITSIIKGGIDSAKEWQQQQAGMRQELKSTGDASGMTADQIKRMAEETENKTAIDKASVLTGQNMLLTFTNIGKNVFPQATQAMTDMATRMNGGMIPNGQQLSQTAIQLGIALNDPINGISRLHRVGVAFTDQQKEQIKQLQQSGDLMGAQKIILDEVGREFGGQAAANLNSFSGQYALWKNRIQDLIGDSIPKLIAKLQEFGSWLVQHKPVLVAVAGAIAGLAVAIGVALVGALWSVVAPAFAAVAALWPVVAAGAAIAFIAYEVYTHWLAINKALKPVYEFFDRNIKPVLQEVWRIIRQQLINAWHDLEKAFDSILKTIKPFEPELKKIAIVIGVALIAPIVLAVGALVALVAAIVAVGIFLARLFGWIAEAIGWFMKFQLAIASAIIHAVEAVVGTGARIIEWFIELPGRILGIVAGAAGWLWQTGINIVQGLVNGIVGMASALWNGVKRVADQIGHFFSGAGHWLYDTGKAIVQGLINGIGSLAHAVEDKVKSVANGIKNVAKKILGIFSPSKVFDEEIGQQIPAGAAQGITKGAGAAVKATTEVMHKIVGAGNNALSGIKAPVTSNMINSNNQQPINYNFGKGSVILQTAEAVDRFFKIGNRSTQLELMGGSPLAGTTGV